MMVVATLAMLVSLLTFIMLLYHKETMKSTFLTFLSIAIAFYLIGNYIEVANDSLEVAKIGLLVRFIGVPFIPTLWYLCVREFCGLKFKNKYTMLILMVVPIAVVYLAFTWEQNHLLISGVEYINGNNNGNLKLIKGPLYNIRLAYQYGINLLGIATLVISFKNGSKRYKKQAALFLVSTLIPIFNIATYIVKVGSFNVDITPYGLLLSMGVFTIALYYFGVLNLSNIIKENAMNHLYEGILLFDHEGIYMDSNRSAREIFPEINSILFGTSIDEMDYLPLDLSSLNKKNNETNVVCEFAKECNGEIKTFNISVSQVFLNHKLVGYSVIFNNISALKRLLLALEEKSIRDPLTQIYNRGYLFEVGNNFIKNISRESQSFSILMLDIDFFKKINDSYGHVFGDYILKTLTLLCTETLEKPDLMARYGGEEFCILFFNTDIEGARNKAEALRLKIEAYPFESENVKIHVTASFGVAVYTQEDESFIDVVKRADINLYKAKESGRNTIV